MTGKNILIFKGSEIFKLHKGMSCDVVSTLLGNDYDIESCPDKNDEKWVYNFPGANGTYKLLFRNKQLEWEMKGVYYEKKTIKLEIIKRGKKQ